MEYEIQFDNGIGGQIYKEFASIKQAIKWAKIEATRNLRTTTAVRIQIGLADLDSWEHDEVIHCFLGIINRR